VLERFDELRLTSRTRFDVLAVRYANENASGNVQSDATPYWTVYYEKGFGPVLIEEIRKDIVTRRTEIK
jgi:hypothetical protein